MERLTLYQIFLEFTCLFPSPLGEVVMERYNCLGGKKFSPTVSIPVRGSGNGKVPDGVGTEVGNWIPFPSPLGEVVMERK